MKALDIGAGLGRAMISMRNNGYDAYGLEPSVPFYERAISRMGISEDRMALGPIETASYPAECFDFITFGAVFEHLYEPARCLKHALQWLKPNGIIHIEVPSSKWLLPKFVNFYYKAIGTNYVTNLSPMHAPFHLYEFALESFLKFAANADFEVAKHRYDVCSIYYAPKVLHGLLRWCMRKTDTGMQLTVYLRKAEHGAGSRLGA